MTTTGYWCALPIEIGVHTVVKIMYYRMQLNISLCKKKPEIVYEIRLLSYNMISQIEQHKIVSHEISQVKVMKAPRLVT